MKSDIEFISKLPISDSAKEQLPDYVRFLKGPESLKALVGVSQVFLELISLDGFEGFPADAYKFETVARELVVREAELKTVFPEMCSNRELKLSIALRSVITQYPAYALLYFRMGSNSKVLMRLQQALLTAMHLQLKGSQPIKKTDISAYGLAVRQLTQVKAAKDWLNSADERDIRSLKDVRLLFKSLPDILRSKHVYESISGSDSDSFDKKMAESDARFVRLIAQIDAAHLLLDASNGFRVIRRNVSAKGVIGFKKSLGVNGVSEISPGDFCEIRVLGDVDDGTEYPEVYAIVKTPGDREVLNELSSLGVEPEEAGEQFEYVFVRHQSIPAYAQTYNEVLRSRGTTKRIELQNQFLPLSTQMLNDQDIMHLFSNISQLEDRSDSDIALILLVMFVTSSSFERAKQVKVLCENDVVSDGNDIVYDLKNKKWVMPVYSLEFKTEYKKEALRCCRDTNSGCFTLPDLFGFHEKLVQRYGACIPKHPFDKVRVSEKLLRKRLAEVDSRLTIKRIERYLMLMVAGQYEATQATYLFNNYLSSSSARRYYTALSNEYYQKIYKDICCQVLVSLGGEKVPEVPISVTPTGYIGARYCPDVNHVNSVLKAMREELYQIRKNLIKKSGSWIEFHNQYTAYVIYAQGLLTGIRSVTSPFVGPDEILKQLDIAVYRDKDSEDQFHTRAIPLHQKAIDLADEYGRHRDAVLIRLAAVNPVSAHELQVRANRSQPFVFLLTPEGQWKTVRPSLLVPWLGKFTPLPLNSNRKLIRNLLCETGVSAHAIDTLLGHASRGEPFWGTYATRSFSDLKAEILDGLEKISNQVDIVVERGIIV